VAICCAVGVLIIVNTGRNNLNEQKLSLSVLRAMGFQHRQIARRWFLQSFLFFVFSLAIGYPVGRTAAIYCLDRMKMSDRAMEYIPAAFQYVWTGILAFGFLVIGHLITVRVMKKWDLVENTKGRE
jgi:ABC-type antimicrobial peptide transport system permease subunit